MTSPETPEIPKPLAGETWCVLHLVRAEAGQCPLCAGDRNLLVLDDLSVMLFDHIVGWRSLSASQDHMLGELLTRSDGYEAATLRELLRRALCRERLLGDNLAATQKRCSSLLSAERERDRFRTAIHEMRTTYARNAHAQEWANFLEGALR